MIRKAIHSLCVLALLLLLGVPALAKGKLMAPSTRALAPLPDQALLVFMRSTFVGSAISASVFDVTGDETTFLGVIYNGNKLACDLAPGEHTFMVVSEAADFMKVTVEAGRIYYALVTPRMGAWKARFSFKPLRQADLDSADFAKWDSKTELVDNTPESLAWAEKNAADIATKRARYWIEWNEKPALQRDSQTLNAEDGRPAPAAPPQ